MPDNFDTAALPPSAPLLPERAQAIFAWATAPARAGVAVLRLSGASLQPVLAWLGIPPLPARTARLIHLRHPHDGSLIDQALTLWFPAPHSFTGEEVLELHTHGSPAVMAELTTLLASHPTLRLAEAGEFSRRAYLNGKLDLLEAEGLADLIDAETHAQKQQALRALQGDMSERLHGFRQIILHALAMMEAYIDFPEEDIPEAVTHDTRDRLQALIATIGMVLDDGGIGQKIRSGFQVAIIGAPNAGKSSLMNALARREVAIVSPQAGTTRDAIEVELDVDGYRVIVTDTAGLRDTDDAVEAEGIRRARQHIAQADLIIALFDPAAPPCPHTLAALDHRALVVYSKADQHPQPPVTLHDRPAINCSTRTADGLEALKEALKQRIASDFTTAHTPLITRARHRVALERTVHHLHRFLQQTELELATEELRLAAAQIAKLTGAIQVDDVLDVVFSSFCIGK